MPRLKNVRCIITLQRRTMLIRINNDVTVKVNENDLDVVDKRLYNKTTKKNEGVDGDLVEFTTGNMSRKGSVDGYTYNDRIKLRGCDTVFTGVKDKRITHICSVDAVDDYTQQEQSDMLSQGI